MSEPPENVTIANLYPSIHELDYQSSQEASRIINIIQKDYCEDKVRYFLLLTDQTAICISNMKLFAEKYENIIEDTYSLKIQLANNKVNKHDLFNYYKNCKTAVKLLTFLVKVKNQTDFGVKARSLGELLELTSRDRDRWKSKLYQIVWKFLKDLQFESQTNTISKLKQMHTFQINGRDFINLLDMPVEALQMQIWNVMNKANEGSQEFSQVVGLINWDTSDAASWNDVMKKLKSDVEDFLVANFERLSNGFSEIYMYVVLLQSYKNQDLTAPRLELLKRVNGFIEDLTKSKYRINSDNSGNIKLITVNTTVEDFINKYGNFGNLVSNKRAQLTRNNSINTTKKLSALMLQEQRPASPVLRPLPPLPPIVNADLKPAILKSKNSSDLKYVIPPIPNAPKLTPEDIQKQQLNISSHITSVKLNDQNLLSDKQLQYPVRKPPPAFNSLYSLNVNEDHSPLSFQTINSSQSEENNTVSYDNLNGIFKNIQPIPKPNAESDISANNNVHYPDLNNMGLKNNRLEVEGEQVFKPTSSASPLKMFKSKPKISLMDDSYELTHHAKLESGLVNLGNSCYLNTVVQCLMNFNNLTDVILYENSAFKKQINYSSKFGSRGDVVNRYMELTELIYKQTKKNLLKKNNKAISPMNFKIACGLKNESFNNFSQQDCQEFLQFLLDILHEDLNNYDPDLKSYPPLTDSESDEREKMPMRLAAAIEWEKFYNFNYSVIAKNFMGQYASKLSCLLCGKTSTTFQTFSILSLPIPAAINKHEHLSIYNCLSSFLRLESLSSADYWNCPQCKKRQPSTKKIIITKFPKNLIIHFKRFDNYLNKNNTLITYPNKLNLNSYYYDNDKKHYQVDLWPNGLPNRDRQMMLQSENGFEYELRSVAKHQGTLTGGHYTSIVKKEVESWKLFDDEKIKKINGESSYINKDAYLLFYSLNLR
ncbi:hypothetical protein QEN19_001738 [Hanseniaspora menglaensis]